MKYLGADKINLIPVLKSCYLIQLCFVGHSTNKEQAVRCARIDDNFYISYLNYS